MRHLPPLLLLAACFASTPDAVRYTVVRGDTLGEIAKAHGVTVEDLLTWNDLHSDRIEVGQILRIETPRGAPEPAPARTTVPPKARKAPVEDAPEGFVLPPEKPCLAAPTGLGDDEGFATRGSAGLAPSQIKAVTDAFVPRTASCAPEGWTGSGTLQVDLTIACTGRVTQASPVSTGGLPDELVACVLDRLRYAPFPAHDLPDGEQARVPLHFAWQPPAGP